MSTTSSDDNSQRSCGLRKQVTELQEEVQNLKTVTSTMTNQKTEEDSSNSGNLRSGVNGTQHAENLKVPKKLSFSLQGLEGPRIHEFDANVVCDLGIPVYQKIVNLVAGLHNVHPSRVSLCVRDPKYPLSTIRGDEDLRMVFKTYGAEEKELALEIAFSIPLFIEYSLQGETDSREIFGIGGVLKSCGHVSFDHLKQLAKDSFKKEFFSMHGKTCKSALSSDEELLHLLYNTEGHKLQVEVHPRPEPKVKLDLSKAELSGRNMVRSSDPPYIEFAGTSGTATWSISGITPGMYQARVKYSSQSYSGRFQVEVNQGAAEGSTNIFKYSSTGSYSEESEEETTESFALPESLAVHKFALKQLDFGTVYVDDSVILEYVGPLKRK
ncbi:hypothetical protein ACA910_004716 [Epithemia clementina (nom. ined.)]